MVDREHVLAAIAAQEQLRGTCPTRSSTWHDALSGPAPRHRAATTTPERRGQASVLFADVAGFTALSEPMDAELVAALMNELWARVDGAIDATVGGSTSTSATP